MKNILKYALLITMVLVYNVQVLYAQKHKKVKVKHQIVAYDHENNEIDSLSKDLSKQSKSSRYLDEIQVELRKLELELQAVREDPNKSKFVEKGEAKKLKLLEKKRSVIEEIQNDKSALVKEYYIVIEAFRDSENAMKSVKDWRKKGYENVFIFNNKYRGWYYIVAKKTTTYEVAVKYQFDLQKEKIPSWIYYWTE